VKAPIPKTDRSEHLTVSGEAQCNDKKEDMNRMNQEEQLVVYCSPKEGVPAADSVGSSWEMKAENLTPRRRTIYQTDRDGKANGRLAAELLESGNQNLSLRDSPNRPYNSQSSRISKSYSRKGI
jgi:hypothetical protein